VASPVSDGQLAFTVASTGNLTCFDMKDGAKLWEQDLQQEVQASPSISGNRLYVPCVSGLTIVVEVGRTYKELARNEVTEKVVASPAFAPGRIYLRGMNSLYALGAAAAPAAKP
jgi:outer membrane protein assembly factor BamB